MQRVVADPGRLVVAAGEAQTAVSDFSSFG
jgi:hypothetical protein